MGNTEKFVLIVEDEDSIRLTLRDFFQEEGIKVLVASDGVGAIKQILDHTVWAIVTDYRMSGLGGDYWIRFLDRYCRDMKIIVTSGFLRPEFPIPFEVVYKPFHYEDIVKLLKE